MKIRIGNGLTAWIERRSRAPWMSEGMAIRVLLAKPVLAEIAMMWRRVTRPMPLLINRPQPAMVIRDGTICVGLALMVLALSLL